MTELKPYLENRDSNVEWLGEIPEHWVRSGARRYAHSGSGAGFPLHLQGMTGEQYPFYKVNALARADCDGVIRFREDTISKPTADALGARIYPAGALVLAKVGAALLLGRIRKLEVDSCIDNNMLAILAGDGVDGGFLSYQLETVDFALLVNPGAVPSLTESRLMSLDLAWPERSEQHAISTFLDHETAQIDAFIADQEELIGLLTERRAATISHAVTKGLDPTVPMKDSGIEWLGEVPGHWAVGQLKHLGKLALGKMLQPSETLDAATFRPYMRAANVQPDGRLDLTTVKAMWFTEAEIRKLTLQRGDVVIVEGGVGGYGRAALLKLDIEDWAFQNSIIRLRPTINECDGRFATFVLLHLRGVGYIEMAASVSSMPHFTLDKVQKTALAWPSLYEQRLICDHLDHETAELDATIADAREAIALSKERRAALISAAVTGKIDVREHGAVV